MDFRKSVKIFFLACFGIKIKSFLTISAGTKVQNITISSCHICLPWPTTFFFVMIKHSCTAILYRVNTLNLSYIRSKENRSFLYTHICWIFLKGGPYSNNINHGHLVLPWIIIVLQKNKKWFYPAQLDFKYFWCKKFTLL